MRGKQAIKRKIAPDYKFQDVYIAKFINYIMRRGKKSVAQKIVYGAFDLIAEKTKKNPVEIFDLAIHNVSPILEIRGRRVGGANYQIPYPVKGDRRYSLAFRWIINASNSRKGRSMKEKLSAELIDAADKLGDAVKKKQDVHRMAEANRAFAHFAR